MAKKKKITYDLFGKLQIATIEREVEDAWNGGISLFFADSVIEHPFACDGYISEGLLLRLIIEYKYDEKMSAAAARARVLVQVLFYLKRFEDGGLPLPNVIMVADKNECFVIHTNDIQMYLDEKADWGTAPSGAADEHPSLVAKIAADEKINPFIFVVKPEFDLGLVVNRIKDLAVNVKRYIRVTEHNIAEIFDYFASSVLRDPKKLEPHELVESFIGVILEPMDYYQHPKNKNILVAKGSQIPIYGDAFLSFFDFYNQNYTPQEKMKFTEIMDRLIEDVTRRRNGEFFTPTPFVDYAHRLLERHLGEDWKERYLVWDCCCGTKNLTRDYRFSSLYCSTLNVADLNISERYNKEATSFVFDFLNSSLEDLPRELKDNLEKNRPVTFFLNPPYATGGSGVGKSKDPGVSKTSLNAEMLAAGIGSSSQNLYAQFIYQIVKIQKKYNLTNCKIGIYCPTLFLTGKAWKGFRSFFLRNFQFVHGIQFKASHFADVSDSWGISFSIWSVGETTDKSDFHYDLIDIIDGKTKVIGTKTVYNIDSATAASEWIPSGIKTEKKEMVCGKSALNISEMTKSVGAELGYFINDTNNVDANTLGVYFMSMPISRHLATYEVNKDNLFRCTALFAARKLVAKNWINSKDEYMMPNTFHPDYDEFEKDSLVFSLFNNSSNQSSLRNIGFSDKRWNIKNGFFWIPRKTILDLANETGNMDVFSDARTDNDRPLQDVLNKVKLSPEASAVLKKANEIVTKTFKYRQLFNEEHPEYQINNWDCGWYQVKAVAAQYAKNDLEEFKAVYNKLAEKMRPKVYEIGFLKDS